MSESPLLVPSRASVAPDGLLVSVTPQSAGWSYVGFEVYRLLLGSRLERTTEGREVCAVILSGRADISFGAILYEESNDPRSPQAS